MGCVARGGLLFGFRYSRVLYARLCVGVCGRVLVLVRIVCYV